MPQEEQGPRGAVRHALTVDVEDWHQLITRRLTGRTVPPSDTVLASVRTILNLLSRRRVAATFFVVGSLAEAIPDIIRAIAGDGHEIATHGYAHMRVDLLTPETFRAEVRRSVYVLERLSGQRVLGHRAPEFSISARTLWALDILAEEGLMYDSSIFPIQLRRYGIADFSRRPLRLARSQGSLVEFPLATLKLRGMHLPAAGGGYLRLLPYSMTRAAVRRLHQEKTPAVIYLHPYEVPGPPLRVQAVDVPGPSWTRWYWSMRHSLGRGAVMQRLDRLLGEFPFGPIRDILPSV